MMSLPATYPASCRLPAIAPQKSGRNLRIGSSGGSGGQGSPSSSMIVRKNDSGSASTTFLSAATARRSTRLWRISSADKLVVKLYMVGTFCAAWRGGRELLPSGKTFLLWWNDI